VFERFVGLEGIVAALDEVQVGDFFDVGFEHIERKGFVVNDNSVNHGC
jgi:hypothetical protein